MLLNPSWPDIAGRLILSLIAGAIIGLNREEGGHAAGFRTTMLVGLGATIAMILANLLLSTSGRTGGSFATMDPMRLPLGILTGVGFIGGGAILRRDEIVKGVTTAATLWAITIIGLCFGAGQTVLGSMATVLVVFALSALKRLDVLLPRERRASLVISTDADAGRPDLASVMGRLGIQATLQGQRRDSDPGRVLFTYDLRWRAPKNAGPPLDLLDLVEQRYRLERFELTSSSVQ